jgi:hypothetical protein
MLIKDHATLEAKIANGEPSRLPIEIAFRRLPVGVTCRL